jgi:hypothetical protein
MDKLTVELFEEEMNIWLQQLFAMTIPKVVITSCKVESQVLSSLRRRLQEGSSTLRLQMSVEGKFTPTGGYQSANDLDFNKRVRSMLSNEVLNNELLEELSDNIVYFEDADDVTVFENSFDLNSVEIPVDNEEKGNGVSTTIIIIIIACGGAALVILIAGFLYIRAGKRRGDPSRLVDEEPAPFDISHMQSEVTRPTSNKASNEARLGAVSPVAVSNSDDGESLKTFNTLEKFYSQDNQSWQSYGYSLDDGIASKASITGNTMSGTIEGNNAPMEMDLFALGQSQYNFEADDGTMEISVGSPTSAYSGITGITGLTFSTTGKKTDASSKIGEVGAGNSGMPTQRPQGSSLKYKRECIAPAGKLGVVIDTTKYGPVVHQVKPGSPLENVLFAGDRIIFIDDVDTRGMTASAVTKLMAKKMDQPRKIIVISSKEITSP